MSPRYVTRKDQTWDRDGNLLLEDAYVVDEEPSDYELASDGALINGIADNEASISTAVLQPTTLVAQFKEVQYQLTLLSKAVLHLRGMPHELAFASFPDPVPEGADLAAHDHGPANEHFHDDNHIPSSIARDSECQTRVSDHASLPHGMQAHSHILSDLPPGLEESAEIVQAIAAHEGGANPHGIYAYDTDLTAHAGTPHGTQPHSHVDGDLPAGLARDAEVSSAIATHAATPHGGGSAQEAWEGQLAVAWGNGDPGMREIIWGLQNTAVSVAGPTPTNIGVAVGRLVRFRLRTALTVNRIRMWCTAAVSGAYTLAIYSGTTRVFLVDPLNTVASNWLTISAGLPITIPANTVMWLGIGAKVVGTTAGFRSPAAPIAGVLNGQVALPGNLDTHVVAKFAQVALTAGAWPVTLPALAAPAFTGSTTGTLPMVFLDNSSA